MPKIIENRLLTFLLIFISPQMRFSMEICKQLFDLGKLFEKIEHFETVAQSFRSFSKQEIEYRKSIINGEITLTPEIVLQDTID